ncbi:uncharacterized protein LOC123272249 [Cotesia glomerata]|uniref:uncharacterized protein LOC123272249 n=1 Tax=Cotesia glomerata TaxID=32391 RepID=UPI001D0233B8|nr:uncharacterized protein LOC123272249 [Cotesia glomerata]
MSDKLRYKGKFIKKKVLKKRLQLISSIKKGRVQKMSVNDDCNLKVGKRIVDIDVLADNLIFDTGKFHASNDKNKRADINTKVVLGAIHAGIGCKALNKVLACANLPNISSALYKRYEREVGPAIEAVAKESCKSAAEEERGLVIKKIDELCKKL